MNWKQEILDAFKQGKTIQSRYSISEGWHDFIPQNQLDLPNFTFGNGEGSWRIKPTSEAEREEILIKSGAYNEPIAEEKKPWEEKHYSKDEMLLFAGFCVGRKRVNPGISGHELWEAWEADFGHD